MFFILFFLQIMSYRLGGVAIELHIYASSNCGCVASCFDWHVYVLQHASHFYLRWNWTFSNDMSPKKKKQKKKNCSFFQQSCTIACCIELDCCWCWHCIVFTLTLYCVTFACKTACIAACLICVLQLKKKKKKKWHFVDNAWHSIMCCKIHGVCVAFVFVLQKNSQMWNICEKKPNHFLFNVFFRIFANKQFY